MDNLTHTLIGATMGKAGLARRSPLAMPALLIGANLPDVDGFGLLVGLHLGFRRGMTHGVLALAIWPLLLTGALLGWDAWRRRRHPDRPKPIPAQLLLVSGLAVISHPLLDWFNSYGMRWLMPFNGRWFYGDTWFIVDPWVLAVLIGALWLGRSRAGQPGRLGPAKVALALVSVYAAAMWSWSAIGERLVRRELAELGFAEPRHVMVAPLPLNPLVRDVLVDDGRAYRRATLAPGQPLVLRPELTIEPQMDRVDRERIAADRHGRQFLGWSRFPFAQADTVGDTVIVVLDDARYARPPVSRSFARTVVTLPPLQ